jgi:hypothetical protein
MPRTPRQPEEPLRKYEARDPELFSELRDKFLRPDGELPEVVARAMALDAAESVGREAGLVAPGRRMVETIVHPHARPVLVIRDNRATPDFVGPESEVWRTRIMDAQAVLDRVIPAVGRVEVGNNPDFTWVGTGWLAAEDIIVTNRHVAREFGRRGAAGFVFRAGTNGGPMTSRIDFLEEDQRLTSLEYGVDSILWIAPPGEADVAFLRVARRTRDRPLPPPIPLAESIAEDDFVATIGYPARDPRVPDQQLVKQIFGDVYDKKRLAPGQVMSVGPDEIEHDCSTLGGNSGSVVVSLKTGQALALHFSGLYMEANYAVSALKVRDLLRRVRQGELPGPVRVHLPPSPTPALAPPAGTGAPGTYTFQLQIPVEITVKVGGVAVPGGGVPGGGGTGAGGPPPPDGGVGGGGDGALEQALRTVREGFANDPDVVDIRLGYRFKRGWITDERVVVVEVREKKPVTELRAAGRTQIPPQVNGVGVDVRTAPLVSQLEHMGIVLEAATEAVARPGQYREPPSSLRLERVRERMRAIFHVSPDSGFPNLKAFLGRVQRHLTATIYEWEAEHISDAIEQAILRSDGTLRMVTQRQGTRHAVEDMRSRLGDRFEHVWASVGAGKLIPSAYHIKVASRDGEELWLSSGNWKRSNQDDIDPAGENSTSITPLREHNREWHAVIANPTLATLFQRYIEFDFDEAQRVPLEEGAVMALPELFVPEAAFMEGVEKPLAVQYFDPLELDRELDVQPLLTPDRDARGDRMFMAHALEMVSSASRRIFLENQSFNLTEENNDEFEAFFAALRDKQRAGVEVKVIFRDAREFGRANIPKQQALLERLKDFGFDMDAIRVQRGCHTKGLIVDSAEVMLGSHNLTNQGSLFNRDASLRIRDAEVAGYFEKIFLFDWNTLAVQEADELVGGIRVAQLNEETPQGFRRVSLSEMLGES